MRRTFIVLLLLSSVLSAGFSAEARNPADMSDEEIWTELEEISARLPMSLEKQRESLNLASQELERSRLEFHQLKTDLIALKDTSTELQGTLQTLSMRLDPVETMLEESQSSLQSFADDMERTMDSLKLKSDIAIGITAVSVIGLIASLIYIGFR